jgi:hypothetical protein
MPHERPGSAPGEEMLPATGPPEPDGGPAPVTCRLCGRPLTGRAARRWGLGEECRAKLRERSAPRPPAREVDQETLPGM